jgi:hypothetical protein
VSSASRNPKRASSTPYGAGCASAKRMTMTSKRKRTSVELTLEGLRQAEVGQRRDGGEEAVCELQQRMPQRLRARANEFGADPDVVDRRRVYWTVVVMRSPRGRHSPSSMPTSPARTVAGSSVLSDSMNS